MNARCDFVAVLCVLIFANMAHAQQLLYQFDSATGNDDYGRSVSGGVDINNDGYSDVVIGAPAADVNGSSSGSVFVYSGVNGALLHALHGATSGDIFGGGVAGIRDLNGDGSDDFIVGAYLESQLAPDAGVVRVFSGADASVLYEIASPDFEDHFGTSVSSAGDVNGDGVADFIVGAPEDAAFSPKREGYAKVFSGATGGLLYTFDGDANGDYFGWSVSGAGDVNHDGRADLIVGANQFVFGVGAGGKGYARVFSGLDGSLLYNVTGDAASDKFGTSVSGVGDVNGDGFDDFAAGAPRTGNGLEGYVRVFSGATGTVLYTLFGFGMEDRFGIAVAAAGDLDRDGRPDLVVGAPTVISAPFAGGPKLNSVAPYVQTFSGATGAVIYTVQLTGQYGSSVDAAGDVNGDDVPDIVVGAPRPLFAGEVPFVQVLSGPPAPPSSCAPVRSTASALGAAAFAAVAGVLAALARRRSATA